MLNKQANIKHHAQFVKTENKIRYSIFSRIVSNTGTQEQTLCLLQVIQRYLQYIVGTAA